jgi:hypothetical protein
MLDEMLDVQAISEIGCDKKLVGQTSVGDSEMEGHVTGVKPKFLISYPNAFFTHWYSHSTNLVLQQSLAIIKESKIFSKL